jgi:hypothetical protein
MVRTPPPGRPLRVAFVGQRTYFEVCVPHAPVGGIVPSFVDFRGGGNVGELLTGLREQRPDAVVVFRPEIIPPGLFGDLDVPVLGFTTEPLPRAGQDTHEQLEANLRELAQADRANFDRVICFDPYGWDAAAQHLPVWRCLPLPVDDRLYRPVTAARRPPRVIFIGYSTWHRETYLIAAKHEFDIGHYAHGLIGAELRGALAGADVGINLHGALTPLSFENRMLLHLASGHLVFSEALEPTFGLEPGIDFVEIESPYDLSLRLHQLRDQPDTFERIRIRGRDKADQFRASRVWPDVIRDLFADLAAFGSERQAERTALPQTTSS